MQNSKRLASVAFLLVFPAVLYSGEQVNPALTAWAGVWSIIEDQSAASPPDPGSTPTVEIRQTADGKGLEISRKASQPPEVKETLAFDGNKKPVQSDNCSGWQTSKFIQAAGAIVTSSEMNCKDAGSFRTSGMRMIAAGNQIFDILGVKVAGQVRVAIRRLQFEHEFAPSGDSVARLAAAAARSAASATWSPEGVIELSKEVDTAVLQAALVERNTRTALNAKSLKQLQRAGVSADIIDLLVALEFPDRFEIQRNGQVALRSYAGSSGGGPQNVYYPPSAGYYPGTFYGCYDPNGVLISPGACWSYYSPLWWDYPVYFGGPIVIERNRDNDARLSATRGYVQIEPRETGRHARPRGGILSTLTSGASPQSPGAGKRGVDSSASSSSVSSSSESSSAPPSGGSSGGSSGGGSSAPSASPGGYHSGSSSSSHATPKD